MNLLEEVIALVKALRHEKSAGIIEDLLAFQRMAFPQLTMARIRQIADTGGRSVDEHEWMQLKFVVEQWELMRRN
jgi:hypothetical protein